MCVCVHHSLCIRHRETKSQVLEPNFLVTSVVIYNRGQCKCVFTKYNPLPDWVYPFLKYTRKGMVAYNAEMLIFLL